MDSGTALDVDLLATWLHIILASLHHFGVYSSSSALASATVVGICAKSCHCTKWLWSHGLSASKAALSDSHVAVFMVSFG